MENQIHNENCPEIAIVKALFFEEHNITVNPDDCFFLYICVGEDIDKMVINKRATVDQIKRLILNNYFCPCCTSDIELKPIEKLYDGLHIEVARVKGLSGDWTDGTDLFIEHRQ